MEGEKHWRVHTGSGNIWLSKHRTRKCSWFFLREAAPSCPWLTENWGTISSSYKGVVEHLEGTAGSTNCNSQSLCGVIVQRNNFPLSVQMEENTHKKGVPLFLIIHCFLHYQADTVKLTCRVHQKTEFNSIIFQHPINYTEINH